MPTVTIVGTTPRNRPEMTISNSHTTITVIIPTLSRVESIGKLLDSLAKQTRRPEQIIIVDASEDHDTEAVAARADAVLRERLEYYRTARGLTRQRNFGLKKSHADIIGFLDDDVVLDDNFLEEMARIFENDKQKEIGGATGYIYPMEVKRNRIHRAIVRLIEIVSGQSCLAKFYNMELAPEEPFTGTVPIRYVFGCNMFFRRQVFKSLQFDEWFEGYGMGEDKDFGLRVAKQWPIVAVGSARLHHFCDPVARPNYFKLGKMSIENRVRILTVARQDRIVLSALRLTARLMIGIVFVGFANMIRGRIREGLNYILGAVSGVKAAIKYICRRRKLVR